jgi:cell division protein FtsB
MRLLALLLTGLLVLIQYPLWLGKGGWLRVWDLDRQVAAHQAANARMSERNIALEGEVKDLRQGLQAIEERARYELGMVRADEIFVHVGDAAAAPVAAAPTASKPSVANAGAKVGAAVSGARPTPAAPAR